MCILYLSVIFDSVEALRLERVYTENIGTEKKMIDSIWRSTWISRAGRVSELTPGTAKQKPEQRRNQESLTL